MAKLAHVSRHVPLCDLLSWLSVATPAVLEAHIRNMHRLGNLIKIIAKANTMTHVLSLLSSNREGLTTVSYQLALSHWLL